MSHFYVKIADTRKSLGERVDWCQQCGSLRLVNHTGTTIFQRPTERASVQEGPCSEPAGVPEIAVEVVPRTEVRPPPQPASREFPLPRPVPPSSGELDDSDELVEGMNRLARMLGGGED